jgi:hypothetical protein
MHHEGGALTMGLVLLISHQKACFLVFSLPYRSKMRQTSTRQEEPTTEHRMGQHLDLGFPSLQNPEK